MSKIYISIELFFVFDYWQLFTSTIIRKIIVRNSDIYLIFRTLLFFACRGALASYPNRFIRGSFFVPSRRFSNLGGKKSGGPWQTRERNSICERKDSLLLRFAARIIGSSANKVSGPHGLDDNYSPIILLSRVGNLSPEIISNPCILGNEHELRIRET